MKPISTRTHGMIDYMTAGLLLALPSIIPMPFRVRRFLQFAAFSTIGYSALTNYELGLTKTLPMETHLSLDGLSGAMMALSPLFLRPSSDTVKLLLLALGLFELGVTVSSESAVPEKFMFGHDVLPTRTNGTRQESLASRS